MKAKPLPPFDCVVFGATGDLTLRKLLPALYWRARDGQIADGTRIIASARSRLDDGVYRDRAAAALREHVKPEDLDHDAMERFCAMLRYVRVDGSKDEGFADLATTLNEEPDRVRVFYMATSPELYGPVSRALGAHKLATDKSRIVLEKPIGHDVASAQAINEEVGRVFSEAQTFRIDHYLGKETVQNLLALRFANAIFERLWTTDTIDHVQITVAETVGVEGRGGYYDGAGQMRDMVQNHMLQLLCLLAMEAPLSLEADALRDEKLRVLRALKPLSEHDVATQTVRGQYAAGAVNGRGVPGYLQDLADDGGDPASHTETFVALKAEVQTLRWGNVPFYLRSGKRLPQKVSEIVVQFRALPFSIFPMGVSELSPNQLIIRLQPEEGVRLAMMTKVPGPGGMRLQRTGLDISFGKVFGQRVPDAYERLLMDVVQGNATLFMRRDEVEAAWRWAEPVLDAWAARSEAPRLYPAGSWGPTAAIALIERDGRTWHEDVDERNAG